MRATGLMQNGKDMNQGIGMKPTGPMKMRQHGNPNTEMNGGEITAMNMVTSKETERKDREEKEKDKERKVIGLQIKEKDKVMGKEKQTKYANPFIAGSSTFIIKCLQFLFDAVFCALDTSQGATEGAWLFKLCIPWTECQIALV